MEDSGGLLEAAPDAMIVVGSEGRIRLVNGQTERLFGYRREELLGQPVEIFIPDLRAALEAADNDRRQRTGVTPERVLRDIDTAANLDLAELFDEHERLKPIHAPRFSRSTGGTASWQTAPAVPSPSMPMP